MARSGTLGFPADRRRSIVLALLLLLAGLAWAVMLAREMPMEDDGRVLTMGFGFPLFVVTWALMMAAMMLPSMSPMLDAFVRIQQRHRELGNRVIPPIAFTAGYLVLWGLSGVVAFFPARWLEDYAMERDWPASHLARAGGGLILAAGVYQLSPAKRFCLSRCRTPMSFITMSWRDGAGGALRMGLVHGGLCLGCCWLLAAILIPLGIMSVAAMVAVTALVFAEKVLPASLRVTEVSAAALIAYGLLVLAVPGALPNLT